MRAVVFEGIGRVAVREVPDARVELDDDALVRVRATAICGSDLHFFHGKAPIEPGETIGHEAVGVVESVGAGVQNHGPGERVVVAFDIVCGACWFCRRGQTQLCEEFRNLGAGAFGGGLGGAQADLVRVPHADVNLMRVPDRVDDESGLFVGDALTTAVYVAGLSGAGPEDTVAVVGAGPLGLLCVQALRARGVRRILALDRETDRLALAGHMGAEPVDVDATSAEMAVARATDGRGADVVIEGVGHPDAFASAVEIVRRGGVVVVAGMYAGEQIQVQLGVYWARAIDLRFSGICPVHAWWGRAMDELVAGRIDPRPIVSHRLPLQDAPRGYQLFDARRATKVLLIP
jgi:alcohol dehydrogenase